MLTIAQKADFRQVVLDWLVARYPLAYGADAIVRMIIRRNIVDYPLTQSDVVEALCFLNEEQFVCSAMVDPALDVLPGWSATSKGVTHIERRQVANDPREARL